MSADHHHEPAHAHEPDPVHATEAPDTGHQGHDHAHAGPRPGQYRAFAIGIGLNLVYLIGEAIAGLASGSTALLADAAHNLGDVLGLGLAWWAVWLAHRAVTPRHSYGHGRATILAAFGNAVLVFLAVGGLTWEAIRHLMQPSPVTGWVVMVAAGIGVLVNLGSALLFLRGSSEDLNRRGVMLHLMTDAAVSVGVVVAGAAILWTGWTWIDPVVALIVGVVVVAATWGLLRESLDLLLDAVPRGIDPPVVRDFLLHQPGVTDVHDLHIWALSTTRTALTGHLVMRPGTAAPDLTALSDELRNRFRIDHITVQVEPGESCARDCATRDAPGEP